MVRLWSRCSLVGSIFLLVSGCERSTPPENLIASGTDFEVSVAELDQVLRAAPSVDKYQVVEQRNQLLDRLVDQKLLATVAEAHELDRNPAVMQQIEAARRGVLAAAYIDSITRDIVPPGSSEAEAFYSANPQRYAGRHVVSVRLLSAPKAFAKNPAIAAALTAKDIAGLSRTLTAASLPAEPQAREMRTDLPPLSGSADAAKLAPGDTARFADEQREYLIVVDSVRPDPVAFVPAAVVKEIMVQQREDVIRREIARLRAERRVTYRRKMLNSPSAKADDAG